MKKIRVNVLALIILSLIIPLFSGCSFKKESYSYDLKNITYSKYLYLTKTVYYSDRVEFHMQCDDTSNIIISDLEVTYPEVKGLEYKPHITIGKFQTSEELNKVYNDLKNLEDSFTTMVEKISVEMIGKNEESIVVIEKKL